MKNPPPHLTREVDSVSRDFVLGWQPARRDMVSNVIINLADYPRRIQNESTRRN